MSLVEKILADCDNNFIMLDPRDYFFISSGENDCVIDVRKVFFDTFSKPFKVILEGYEVEYEFTKYENPEDWVFFYFDNEVEDIEKLIRKLKDQWQNLRTKSKRAWLNKKKKHNAKQARELSKYQNYRCAYCNIEYTEDTGVDKDHVEPVAAGGTDEISNIVFACPRCNISKMLDDPKKFLKRLEKEGVIESSKEAMVRFNYIRKYSKKLEKI